MKTTIKLFAILAIVFTGATASLAEITTGWQSPLDGTYTWSDTANWVDGEINGIFSDGLVGSGKTYPTILFSADATLSGGLTLNYTNNEQNLTFRGDGTDRTLTLGGPLSVNLHKATKGSVKFGSTTAGQGLSLHFTDAPVFDVGYGPWVEIFQAVSGGDALVTGVDGTATVLTLHGDAATFPGAVSVTRNKGLYFNSNDKNAVGAIRATAVRLDRADIVVQGNSGAASEDRIFGALTLAGGGMSQFIHYYNANFKNHTLRVGSLVVEPGAILDIHSPSLVLGATAFENGNNFIVDNGVTTFGTGDAGTVTAPVVPFARASNNNSTGDNMFGYLVSYDATRGFRILDRDTEQEHYEAGYVGPVTNQGANAFVSLAGGQVVEFTGDNIVNSLQFSSSSKGATLRACDGDLIVSSGAIEMTGDDNIVFNANLVFGNVSAYITYRGNKTGSLKGTLSGSAGVTFQSFAQISEMNSGITVESTGTYTGPTYINSRVFIGTVDFLPHGERLGDVYVNGILNSTSGAITMNGLYGNGALRHGQSYATTFTVGDNNSNGDFNGGIERANGTVNFTKTGTGTQRIAGHCTHNGATTVSGGTLIVDGDFTASSVTVAAGAALGGSGGITNTVTFADGAKLAVTVVDGVASCLAVAGAVTGGPVTVNANATGKKWRDAQCILKSDVAIEASFVKGEGIILLELRNNDTELWATPKTSGLYVIIR